MLGQTWVPKTGRDRSVPISSALRVILAVHVTRPGAPWFFQTPGGCRWDVDNFGAALRSANRTRELPWTALDYRHTFGSQLAMKGVSLLKIAELLGNSPEVCRRHYAALLPESLVDAVEFGR